MEGLQTGPVLKKWSDLGTEIRRLRLAQKPLLTQAKLAESINSDERYMRKIEAGEKRPSRENLLKLLVTGLSQEDVEQIDRVLRVARYERLWRKEIRAYRLHRQFPTGAAAIPIINPERRRHSELPALRRRSTPAEQAVLVAKHAVMVQREQIPKATAPPTREENALYGHYRRLLSRSRIGIYVLDRMGKVRFWNRAAKRIFGWTEEEALKKRPPFLDQDEIPEFDKQFELAARTGVVPAFSLGRYRKDGSPIDLVSVTRMIHDHKGIFAGILLAAVPEAERNKSDRLRRSVNLKRMRVMLRLFDKVSGLWPRLDTRSGN